MKAELASRGRSALAAEREPTPRRLLTVAPLCVWAGLVALSAGTLVGGAEIRGGWRILLPAAIGLVTIAFAPRASRRLPWRSLLAVTVLTAATWAVALALVDGREGLTRPLESQYEYLHDVPLVGDSPREFLGTFTERIGDFTTHVQGHPPGTILALWTLDRVGLGGASWAAALLVLAGASSAAAASIALRNVAGEAAARRAAPFLVLMPAAIWLATSADALYLGVGAWAVTSLILSTARPGMRSDVQGFGGGLLLGAALFLSYGIVPLIVVVVAVSAARRRVRPLVFAGLGIATVAAAFALAGFWWPDGLRATIERYEAGAASRRSYGPFLVTNLGAFAVALGPAAAVALARLRDRRVWLLAGGALAAVAIADVSGLSKGEVERIWLPFVPWALTACAVLSGRGWLALQAAAGVVVQVVLRSPW